MPPRKCDNRDTMAADELSPSEVAARIGTTTRSVQRWIVTGRLPARRVGGRWRVSSDAIDALVAEGRNGGAAGRPADVLHPIRTVFVANRGEIAARIARTCDRLAIRAIVPDVAGPSALDLLDVGAVVAAAVAAGADAVHPGFRLPGRERGLRRARPGGGDPVGGATAGCHPGDGRQSRGATSGCLPRCPGSRGI